VGSARPSRSVTVIMLPPFLQFLKGFYLTMTLSPHFTFFLVHPPARAISPIDRPSKAQMAGSPFCTDTVIHSQTCGFVHSKLRTVPETWSCLEGSNILYEWRAGEGSALNNEPLERHRNCS
jgi:hypothetical protein